MRHLFSEEEVTGLMLTLFPSDPLAICALVGAHDGDSIRVAFDEGEHAVARGQVSDVMAEVKKVNPVPAW